MLPLLVNDATPVLGEVLADLDDRRALATAEALRPRDLDWPTELDAIDQWLDTRRFVRIAVPRGGEREADALSRKVASERVVAETPKPLS